MRKIIFPLFFCVLSGSVFSQAKGKGRFFSSPKKAVLNVSEIKSDFYTDLQCVEKPLPGGIPKRETVSAAKKAMGQPAINQAPTLTSPYLGRNFLGNPFYSSTPNDNDIAVSDSCKIVSVSNTLIYFHDCAVDSAMGTMSLSAFSNALGLVHDEFDPIVEYDPMSDRFVLLCLNGSIDTTSNIILGFTQTNDPKGAWNLYTIPGNPKNNGLWTDYPMMSLTQNELFITVNLLYPDSSWQTGFVETLVWQVNKFNGYTGTTLNMQMHDSILWNGKPVRNLCPARGGSQLYGPNQYFVSNRNFGVACDTVFLVEITDTMNAPGQALVVKQLNADKQYSFPPEARQVNAHRFATNDCRNLGCFFENDKVQFVHNTLDTVTGFCGVYHGVIHDVSLASPTVNGYIVNDTLRDLGYPVLAYSGSSSTDNSSIISFNHVAPTIHAGCSVIKSDGAGQYSNILTVKNGTSYVNVLSSYLERWGDYSGSQRKYNEPDKIWMNGYYGYYSSGLRKHGTWIGEISLTPVITGVEQDPVTKNVGELFPNPAIEIVNVKFSVEKNEYLNFVLYDLNGRVVQVLMREYVKAGAQNFSFSLHPVPAGSYFLKIYNSTGSFDLTQKLQKS
jgi:hypothetical protein